MIAEAKNMQKEIEKKQKKICGLHDIRKEIEIPITETRIR